MPVCHAGLILCVCAVKTIGIVGVLSHPPGETWSPTEARRLGKVHTCTNPKLHTRIHMECEHARSSAMPEFYAYMRTHTEYTVMLRAVKILISAWTAARLSRQCLSPLLTPLSVLCPLRLLLLLCSVVISPPSSPPFLSSPTLSPPILLLHLSPQSAPEWPCYVGGCEADSQHTHRPQYHPLICLARPNSPHSVPADSVR